MTRYIETSTCLDILKPTNAKIYRNQEMPRYIETSKCLDLSKPTNVSIYGKGSILLNSHVYIVSTHNVQYVKYDSIN